MPGRRSQQPNTKHIIEVGRVVEDGADRADEQDEAADLVHRPRARLGDLLAVHIVGRDRHLREIVEQLLVRTWIGSIGRNGKKALAPSTLNMLPKLELAPMRMYLRMLANTLRPSSTPSSSTRGLSPAGSCRRIPWRCPPRVSTEMPTSAARSAGASLMPSPMKPTTCPR